MLSFFDKSKDYPKLQKIESKVSLIIDEKILEQEAQKKISELNYLIRKYTQMVYKREEELKKLEKRVGDASVPFWDGQIEDYKKNKNQNSALFSSLNDLAKQVLDDGELNQMIRPENIIKSKHLQKFGDLLVSNIKERVKKQGYKIGFFNKMALESFASYKHGIDILFSVYDTLKTLRNTNGGYYIKQRYKQGQITVFNQEIDKKIRDKVAQEEKEFYDKLKKLPINILKYSGMLFGGLGLMGGAVIAIALVLNNILPKDLLIEIRKSNNDTKTANTTELDNTKTKTTAPTVEAKKESEKPPAPTPPKIEPPKPKLDELVKDKQKDLSKKYGNNVKPNESMDSSNQTGGKLDNSGFDNTVTHSLIDANPKTLPLKPLSEQKYTNDQKADSPNTPTVFVSGNYAQFKKGPTSALLQNIRPVTQVDGKMVAPDIGLDPMNRKTIFGQITSIDGSEKLPALNNPNQIEIKQPAKQGTIPSMVPMHPSTIINSSNNLEVRNSKSGSTIAINSNRDPNINAVFSQYEILPSSSKYPVNLPLDTSEIVDILINNSKSNQPKLDQFINSLDQNKKFTIELKNVLNQYKQDKSQKKFVDNLKALIQRRPYEFNNLETQYGDIEKTATEVSKRLEQEQGVICNQANIFLAYMLELNGIESALVEIQTLDPLPDGSLVGSGITKHMIVLAYADGSINLYDATSGFGSGVDIVEKLKEKAIKEAVQNNPLQKAQTKISDRNQVNTIEDTKKDEIEEQRQDLQEKENTDNRVWYFVTGSIVIGGIAITLLIRKLNKPKIEPHVESVSEKLIKNLSFKIVETLKISDYTEKQKQTDQEKISDLIYKVSENYNNDQLEDFCRRVKSSVFVCHRMFKNNSADLNRIEQFLRSKDRNYQDQLYYRAFYQMPHPKDTENYLNSKTSENIEVDYITGRKDQVESVNIQNSPKIDKWHIPDSFISYFSGKAQEYLENGLKNNAYLSLHLIYKELLKEIPEFVGREQATDKDKILALIAVMKLFENDKFNFSKKIENKLAPISDLASLTKFNIIDNGANLPIFEFSNGKQNPLSPMNKIFKENQFYASLKS